MQLSKRLEEAINRQINAEFYSSYLYLSMAAYCESVNMGGFAKWLRVQQQEEWMHGMKLFDFLVDRGAAPALEAIAKPANSYKSMLDVFQQVLKHEQDVSASIQALCELAQQEKDFSAQALLGWFITEQIEEEKTATQVVEQLKIIPEKGGALLFIDRHMAKRGEK